MPLYHSNELKSREKNSAFLCCQFLNFKLYMCLYPRIMRNPRYINKEYLVRDLRLLYVSISCGECWECRRQKAQSWRVRLHEELKVRKYAYFVTLTFSNESLAKLCEKYKCDENNGVATAAVRMFLERYRKVNKKSLRHWLITELGHTGTERIHLHGIIFPDKPMTNEDLLRYWQYGRCDTGQYCNRQSINYIVKYVTKLDNDHKFFRAIILSSPGIGKEFTKTIAAQRTYKYKKGETPEYYTLPTGFRVALPRYYAGKLYNDVEREKMWVDRLNTHKRYVNGIEVNHLDTKEGQKRYMELLKEQQEMSKALGYGSTAEEWKQETYNTTFKQLNTRTYETHARAED